MQEEPLGEPGYPETSISSSVVMEGEVRSRSTRDIKPLESSHLSASPAATMFFAT